jgi:hypothetical protein
MILASAERLDIDTSFDLTTYTGRAEIATVIYLLAVFCIGMVCHGETTRRVPRPGQLTLYYLAIAAGGALGSAVVAVVCPVLLNRYLELNAVLVFAYLLAGGVIVTGLSTIDDERKRYLASGCASLLLATGFALVIWAQAYDIQASADIFLRNFYGVASVKTEKSKDGVPVGRVLYNGHINHGYQFLEGPRRYRPNAYYPSGSGVDVAFNLLREQHKPLRVGVIGLGTGTLASFGRSGDSFQFYEIDPKINLLAHKYFTYLEDSKAETRVRLGDARLYLDRQLHTEGDQEFDLLVLDAFSGDAIPVHLLTLEAFRLYVQHINATGILAVHVSNRHLNLAPVVARLAAEVNAWAVLIERGEDGSYSYNAASDWVLVGADPELLLRFHVSGPQAALYRTTQPSLPLSFPEPLPGRLLYDESSSGPLWTDSFSNLLQVLD